MLLPTQIKDRRLETTTWLLFTRFIWIFSNIDQQWLRLTLTLISHNIEQVQITHFTIYISYRIEALTIKIKTYISFLNLDQTIKSSWTLYCLSCLQNLFPFADYKGQDADSGGTENEVSTTSLEFWQQVDRFTVEYTVGEVHLTNKCFNTDLKHLWSIPDFNLMLVSKSTTLWFLISSPGVFLLQWS